MRIEGRAESRVLRTRTHGELIEIGLAEQHGTGTPEPVGDRGLVGRHEALQHAAGAGGAHPTRAEVVLDRQRNASQGRQGLNGGALGVDAVGVSASPLSRDLQVGIHRAINGLDAAEVTVGELAGGHLATPELLTPLGDAHQP